jgi:hypothetical protein
MIKAYKLITLTLIIILVREYMCSNCETSYESKSMDNCEVCLKYHPKCHKCRSGYGLSDDQLSCTKCEGDTQSDGTHECRGCDQGY